MQGWQFRLSSFVLAAARAIVWGLSLAVIGLFVFAASQYYAYAIDLPPAVLPNAEWTPELLRTRLAEIGWSVPAYALYQLVGAAAGALASAVVGLLILWRRGNHAFGLLLAFELIFIGVAANPVFRVAQTRWPALDSFLIHTAWFVWPGFFICFYLFPDGQFRPRWTRWCALAWAIFSLVGATNSGEGSLIPSILFVALLVLSVSALATPVYRFVKTSDPVQRQQTKVVVAAIAALLLTMPVQFLVNQTYGNSATTSAALGWQLVNSLLGLSLSCLLPLAIGVAMLRYRLWDVDIIINRALVYGALTATLALIYLGSIVILQALLRPLIGLDTELATVASTLAMVALFQPLRRRIQGAIDRRFFRRKYNAQQTLQAFSARLRDETDLQLLTDATLEVVHETLQPTHVSIWLRESGKA